ncbi:MAG: hypothetical protein IPL35_14095 [Sphingobacteriales bacterium]|nr:hypothetical protein [Sphingobacteriales bacterium]
MVTKIILFCFFTLFLFFSDCSCRIKDNDCHGYYEIEIPFHTEGTPDTLVVGDTLWFNADFSDTLPDIFNIGEKWHLHDFDFKGYVQAFRIDVNNVDGISLGIDVFASIGQVIPFYFSSGDVMYDIKPSFYEAEHRYRLRFGVIPKQKGVYHFFMGSLISDGDMEFEIDEECRYKQPLYVSYSTNNRGDNNRHLFLASPDSAYVHSIDNLKLLDYWETGSYCFVVK